MLQQAGLSCVEYVEQLTLLLFLKMADQYTEPPYSREPIVPVKLGWKTLLKLNGAELEAKYEEILEKLALKPGMLGVIFKGARCEIRNPALLKQLIVNLIDKEDWVSLPVDVKGTIHEELLQRSAAESTKGAGQYFTTRAHTLLRLPTGIWYSPGVKANVIFFDKKEGRAKAWTDKLWVYDLRTNQHFTLKQKPICSSATS